jgi:carboxypeptidase Taq
MQSASGSRNLMLETPQELLDKVSAYARETALLESIEGLLGWDERTMLPPAGGDFRADQATYVAGWLHRRRIDPRYGDWLERLSDSPLAAEPHSDAGATIYHLRRDFQKQTRLPTRLVEELARTTVLGQQAWVTARHNNDYAAFRPLLDTMIRLKREQADAVGYPHLRYDALLDDYEPGALTSEVTQVLEDLRLELVTIVAAIADSGRQAPRQLLRRSFPISDQEQFGRDVAARIGFDFQRGRLDVTAHPFCSSLGPHDCRITTHYDEHSFAKAFFGTLHEAGHGIYDQGLRVEQFGLPPGNFCSLGIHESQSRMWENFVGRSYAFWKHFFEPARQRFPRALADVSLDEFYFAVNDVQPSLIRVEADEATYNLHIIIRFELEQALIEGQLTTHDLPHAWREKYQAFLGIQPPRDAEGVLQDIHWSAGLFGYFPTYTLGNLFAAQLFEAADRELGGLSELFAAGDYQELRQWLRENIHHPGRCYAAADLIERVSGRPLSHAPLVRHLQGKLGPLYAV